MSSCVIGVDLGGTNVRAGAFYADGTEAGPSYSHPSNAQKGTDAILRSIADTILQAVSGAKEKPIAVGMAVPGHIDDRAGEVIWAPNFGEEVNGVFRYWEHVQLRKPLEEMTGQKIFLGNDANLAALGEYRFGSGKNSAKCLVMLTLGTGIGGGVVLSPASVDGQASGPLVLVGGNKGGAELGHVVINYQGAECSSGEYGSIESYCQRDAIVRRAQHRMRRGRVTVLNELVGGDLGELTPLHLYHAAQQGDEVAIEVFEEVGTLLGVGIGNYINIFAPDVVAIGGQVAKAGDFLMGPAIRSARNVAIASLYKDARIIVAEQIEDAGMLGGAAMALEACGVS